MKIIRLIILLFYMLLVVPICVVIVGSLAYGAVVETIKTLKKP